jgi:VanZ family protein
MNALIRSLRGPLTTNRLEPFARAVPVVLYMGVIFLGSAVPGGKITIRFDDRVAHFLEYAVLGALLVFFAASLSRGATLGATAAILAFVAFHAVADEYHQSFVPQRDPSAKDWMFDMAGATTAVVLLRFVAARESR